MENVTTSPSLKLPNVPDSFEASAGNTRVDFAKALFALLGAASVTGITDDDPSEFDFGALQSKVNSLETLFSQAVRNVRRVTLNGVTDGVITPIFDDIGTLDYSVSVAFTVPASTVPATVNWYLVQDSKQTDRCQIYIKGIATSLKCEISIVSEEQG